MHRNGEGVPQDHAKAIKYYTLAADQGVANAQCNLGCIYADGRGVKQNHAMAVEHFRNAAHQGHAAAQYNLGSMYANGEGVKQNDAKAVEFFCKAAHQGDAVRSSTLESCTASVGACFEVTRRPCGCGVWGRCKETKERSSTSNNGRES